MKANAKKQDIICSSNGKANLAVENEEITNNKCVKLLVVKTDSQLTFKTHVNDICNKVRQKLNALAKKKKKHTWIFYEKGHC